jgi:hypothetical protein
VPPRVDDSWSDQDTVEQYDHPNIGRRANASPTAEESARGSGHDKEGAACLRVNILTLSHFHGMTTSLDDRKHKQKSFLEMLMIKG